MDKHSRIYVANHEDMVGNSIVKELRARGYENLLLCSEKELDLTDEVAVERFFTTEKPEHVFCFIGPHGGIIKNTSFPADIIYNKLKAQGAVLHSAYKCGVKKLLFLVGSCLYPKYAEQPILEDYFMSGKMEPTSAAYSTACAAGVEMCWAYNRQYETEFIPAVIAVPYGPGDDFSEDGHVVASVMNKLHRAKQENTSQLMLWGTGTPKRQFIYSEDLARACVQVMNSYEKTELINIAGECEVSIFDLVTMLKEIVGYKGEMCFDPKKPDGTPRKFLDGSKLKELEFSESVSLKEGLKLLYEDYLNHI